MSEETAPVTVDSGLEPETTPDVVPLPAPEPPAAAEPVDEPAADDVTEPAADSELLAATDAELATVPVVAASPAPAPAPAPEPTPVAASPRVATPTPAPRPTPAMIPRRQPAAPAAPALPTPSAEALRFGRVDEEGTVFVRTSDGERAVGSFPGTTPHEALAYFARKYDELVAQVALFEQRLAATDVSISEIDSTLAKLRTATTDPQVVGDLPALTGRVEALAPLAAARKAQADAARARAREEARAKRAALVEEAEQIAATDVQKVQWRSASQRMQEIFELWRTEQKADVRLDRKSQDELWKRFAAARTGFDRMRRQHFAQLDETQGAAKAQKEKLVSEAEQLQTSTDWATTATAYKKLMDRWRDAGRASRRDDDALWARFRAAQDAFFAARSADAAVQDKEFAGNLEVKLQLIAEAEALLPVTDLPAAKRALRDIQDRYEAVGKVPRADIDRVERRMRAVEQSLRDAEDARWKSRNPEGEARARSAVEQLESVLEGLTARRDKARAAGDARAEADAQAGIDARQLWLDQARKALRDFGG